MPLTPDQCALLDAYLSVGNARSAFSAPEQARHASAAYFVQLCLLELGGAPGIAGVLAEMDLRAISV